MGYYQSAVKKIGKTLVTGLLTALVLAGCVAHNAEKKSPETASAASAAAVPQAESSAAGDALRAIKAITANPGPDQLEIWIQGNRALEYTSIKQSFPFAVSVYLPDTRLSPEFSPATLSDDRVSGIKTAYADQDQTTVKVDILLNQDLPYVVKEEGDRLGIVLQGGSNATASKAPGTSRTAGKPLAMPKAETGLAIPETPAELTGIEFDTGEAGYSDIRIQTTHPVRYETRQGADDQLILVLYNTKIPDYHQRPLLTRYFNSAVERVDPKPAAKDTRIHIKIREQVPFRIVQNRSGIYMRFEPSSVRPPEFAKAKKTLESGQRKVISGDLPSSVGTSAPAFANPMEGGRTEADSPEEMLGQSSRPYTGEKIKLDFYETDIKNVFRILKSVSGRNFAIDSDVEGNVTLSLQEPVPWDQVLDLILKMNGLGKKMEGNVVRIATAATLEKEEQLIQDALAARRKSLEQKKALEPLITEYIPINYSDATNDIKPHLDQIVTPKRGTVSVDQRTNTIIITDTQAVLDRSYDLINRLDQVTPQIMIEAKIVEVTKEFSRTLGMSWNLSNSSSVTSGFVDDHNVAVNVGDAIGLSGDFSFFRLFGSSVTALNAKLAASEELGDVKIISSPRVLTLDNKKAMIKQGQEYPYLERDDSGGATVKFKDIDLLLEVTPHVTMDKRIAMNVRLTKNDVADIFQGVPVLDVNEAETELLVNNQDTIVIGGVVKTTTRQNDDGIPFLTGIPGLGLLFSTQKKEDNRDELLIFLTPSIVQLEQKRKGAKSAKIN